MYYCPHCEEQYSRRCPGCNALDMRFVMILFPLAMVSCLVIANLAIAPFYSNEGLPEVSQSVDGVYQVSFNAKKSTLLWLLVPLCVGASSFIVFRVLLPPYGIYKDTGKKGMQRYKLVLPWVSEVVIFIGFAIVISLLALISEKEFGRIVIKGDVVRLESLLSSEEIPKSEICFVSASCRKNKYGDRGGFCLQIKTASGESYYSHSHPPKASQRKAIEDISKKLMVLCKANMYH